MKNFVLDQVFAWGWRHVGMSFPFFVLYFAEGPEKHSAKYLPCARNVAHGKQALCRPLYAVSCLPCVTLGKHFAECKPAFAMCPWHTANTHSPVVTPPLPESHNSPCAKNFAVCKTVGTRRKMELPCARKKMHGESVAHGETRLCRVPHTGTRQIP